MILFIVQVMGLLQVVVCAAASKAVIQPNPEETTANAEGLPGDGTTSNPQKDAPALSLESDQPDGSQSKSDSHKSTSASDVFLLVPASELHNLCGLLGHEGYCFLKLDCCFSTVLVNLYSLSSFDYTCLNLGVTVYYCLKLFPCHLF